MMPQHDAELPKLKLKDAVVDLVKRLGIHPGIVVGRLEYDKVIAPYLNEWVDSGFSVNPKLAIKIF